MDLPQIAQLAKTVQDHVVEAAKSGDISVIKIDPAAAARGENPLTVFPTTAADALTQPAATLEPLKSFSVKSPIVLSLGSDSECTISATAKAYLTQRVTVTVDDGGQKTYIFAGSGENVGLPYVRTDDKRDTGPLLVLPSSGNKKTLTLTFNYGNSSPLAVPSIQQLGPESKPNAEFRITEWKFMTEDATDGDKNDTYLNIICRTKFK